jgi:hypothetical protein
MKCNEIEILISEYIDNELPETTRLVVTDHLNNCDSCRKIYEDTLLLVEKVSLLQTEVVPVNDLWSNIESRINKKDETENNKKIIPLKTELKINHGKYRDRPSVSSRYMKYGAITLIAAMILIALLPSLLTDRNNVKIDVFKTSWPVINIKGVTTIGSKLLYGNDSLKIGDWLETKDSSQARLDIQGLGSILIEPNSRVQIIRSDSGEHRIALEYGTINANINAKPRTFFVDTKSATAIDYGCEYTLSVDKGGDGILYVKEGMVALESNGRQSLVPAGKFCMSKTGIGPGTPYRKNSSEEFKTALIKYDFGNGGSESINTLLKYAKKSDAVTLMNILPRVDEQLRSKVYSRVVEFVPPPKNYRHDSIPHLNMEEINEWINKVQIEVSAEIEKSLKEMEKNLKENLNFNFNFDFKDTGKFNKWEFNEKMQENLEHHMEKLEKLNEIYDIPFEQLEKELEKLNKQMENFHYEYKFDSDKMQRNLDKAQRKLEQKLREKDREFEHFEREFEQMERNLEQQEREAERYEREMERQQELQERLQEQEIERQNRESERMHELEERQKEREKEFEVRQKEREERLKERLNEKDEQNDSAKK